MEYQWQCFTNPCALWLSNFMLLMLLSPTGLLALPSETLTAEFADDRLALLSFKSFISYDSLGALASWNEASLHFCQWRGVTCGNFSHQLRVTALELEFVGLIGSISPSLANLTYLQRLHLPRNRLEGPIPQELGFLSHLRHLNLSYNPLVGLIPTSLFQNCSHLQNFSLSYTHLWGTIPRDLNRCLELQHLELNYNKFGGGIPSELGSLSKLKVLSLEYNRLTGSIPFEIQNLVQLTELHLRQNQLSSPIPDAIWNLSSLSRLDLSSNHLTGAIPSDIGNLVGLTDLHLCDNKFNGTIPSKIGNLVNLKVLSLGGNHLIGTIPKILGSLQSLTDLFLNDNKLEARNAAEWSFIDALTNCTNLRRLDLSGNYLGGMLPRSIANLSKTLEWLVIHRNQLVGTIPAEIGSLTNLTRLTMHSNLLGGSLPATLGSLPSLGVIELSGNFFTGGIPTTLGNLTRLNRLLLSSNELYGSIPPSLGNCSLHILDLAFNKLTGTIPKEIMSIPTLTILLNVSHNSLTGYLPSEVGNLGNIQAIDVSNNRLSGKIPSTIGQCKVLQYLYMQKNCFEGPIPSSFNQLKGLQVLDLSSNNFSGHIPDFLGSFLNMKYLNLSYNNLDGELPKDGIFINTSAFSVLGNKNLCGGVPELNLPQCSNQTSRKKQLSAVLIAVSLVLCFSFLISVLATLCWLHKSRGQSSATLHIKEKHRKVSFADLLRATDGFSPANLIGMGSFGSVYKGIMDWEDHKDVAVKVLNLQQKGASRCFIAECEAFRNVRHRNLVKVLTSCSSVDFQGNDFKALVFEFLSNGSLEKWLHPVVDEQGASGMLSLILRLNISIDVASALRYLHHHAPTPIIHCDLKPSNVLLDDNMVAHVSDFGLARFLNRSVSKSSHISTSSVTLKGSIGYAAPEYGVANKVSAQGDVYSYGILLLEMFTGKRPTDDIFKEGLSLHQYVKQALPEQVVQIIDPHLKLERRRGETSRGNQMTDGFSGRKLECITSVLKVGIVCSKESPKERMHMEDVIRELHNIRDAFLGLAP